MAQCLASIGYEAEDLFQHFAPYLSTVSLTLDTGVYTCEAVILSESFDGILLATPGAMPSWQASVEISVDTDGLENRMPRTIPVQYHYMPLAAVQVHASAVPDNAAVTPWELHGGTPVIAELLLNIPVTMLPDELFERLASMDGEELADDDGGWSAADFRSAEGSLGVPPAVLFKAAFPPAMGGAAPAEGQLLTGGGRGRGGPRTLATPKPRLNMATLSDQLAQVLSGQTALVARLEAIEASRDLPPAGRGCPMPQAGGGLGLLPRFPLPSAGPSLADLVGPGPPRPGPPVANFPPGLVAAKSGSPAAPAGVAGRRPRSEMLAAARSAPGQLAPATSYQFPAGPHAGAAYPPPPSAVSAQSFVTAVGGQAGGIAAQTTHGIAEALRAQTEALQLLVKRRAHPLGEDEEGSEGEDLGLRGARGAMAMEAHRRAVAKHPERVISRMRKARDAALSGPAALPGIVNTYRGYFASEVPFGKTRTAAYLVFGLCEVVDLMEAGQGPAAHATALLLLAASEQAALHDWHWPPAWLLTHLPEPPFTRINHMPAKDAVRPLSRLADPRLVAASMAYLRDIATVTDAGRRRGPLPGEEGLSTMPQAPAGRGRGAANAGRGKAGPEAP